MKKNRSKILVALLALALFAACSLSAFAYEEEVPAAQTGEGTEVTAEDQALEIAGDDQQGVQVINNDPVQQPGNEDQQGPPEGDQEQPKEEPKVEPAPPVDPEAEKIAQYGYYTGENATRIPVLTYHMVMSNKQKAKGKYRRSSLAVSQSTFDKQMKYLVDKGYRFVNCDEFYLWYTGKINLPPRSVLVTFDDGYIGVAKYALPVLQKYNIKGTTFIVGTRTMKNKKNTIGYNLLLQLRASQSNLDFQSHTYGLHKKFSKKGDYAKVMADAAKQKGIFGFEYLAYPYGRNTPGMRAAYADSGIKLAFTYGKNGYATRSQNIYQIRRIKVDGRKSFKAFKKWVK